MKTGKFIVIGCLFLAGCIRATPVPEISALPVAVVVQATSLPIAIPPPLPLDSADYQDWWRYVQPEYGFSILLPPFWVAEEAAADDALLKGHLLWLYPQVDVDGSNGARIRMTFRQAGDDTLLWPTSAGDGVFVEQGGLEVAHQAARRMLLVCPDSQVNSIWYHGKSSANLLRADMEFGFIFESAGTTCQDSQSIDSEVQREGEMIIASLVVPLP